MRKLDITDGKLIYAQIYNLNIDGKIIFPTSHESEMQCGFGTVDNQTEKQPHIHKVLKRTTRHTSEFFFIYEGSVLDTFYDNDENIITSELLEAGMGFIQFFGGHGFSFSPKTKYIEVKQGPYIGNKDDKYFLNKDKDATK